MPATKKKIAPTVPAAEASAPALSPEPIHLLPAGEQAGMYREMLRIRRFEERCAQLYGQGKIGGFCHLYIGQEAVAVGSCAVLRPDDYVITTYRDHGHAILRGISPEAAFAELMGRETGCTRGRGGSMHLFSKTGNFMGGHGIVGGHIPLGTGAAFASKYRGQDSVTLCYFGDGAVNNGAFHESLNLASLWELPIVYICENNRYGMGTPVERASSIYDIHKKAEGYDMAHACIDGMSLEAVYAGLKEAVANARQYRPTFIEMRTYRFRGHSMSDPIHSHYRTKAEVEEQKQLDPLKTWRESLIQRKAASAEELDKIENEVNEEMKAAAAKAEKAPEPHPDTVMHYVEAE
jgi:pyruvate dehydrogenase E1 component alpha subunit